MKISLDNIGKRFQRHWIFKDVNISFTSPGAYALLGPNGSGKSTLLRVIATMQTPSKGKVHYDLNGSTCPADKTYKHISFTAPSQEIVEEFTLREFLDFHFSFKSTLSGLSIDDIINITGLQAAQNKPIADYSSGMKQRVKLAQAIFSNTQAIMLDEPCTNLDDDGVQQYRSWIEQYTKDRIVIVASNDIREYFFCTQQYKVEDYK